MERYTTIEKLVGETPLQSLDRLRNAQPELKDVPLAYAGRLDPMANGKLLVLIGDECKKQKHYHSLDKEYVFEVLLGVYSDTGDVLGVVTEHTAIPSPRAALGLGIAVQDLRSICKKLRGVIELPYPHFSSKTVRGKPLHTWALENRLAEITIPTKRSTVYALKLISSFDISKESLEKQVYSKIQSLPRVTEVSKELGKDFRRADVLASWNKLFESTYRDSFHILQFRCICSSGTYMRTLAEIIAQELHTKGLALSINRTKIGHYAPIIGAWGIWQKQY